MNPADPGAPVALPSSEPNPVRRTAGWALSLGIAGTALLGAASTVIWATAGGYYWPGWVWVGCLTGLAPLAIHVHLQPRARDAHRRLIADADTSAALSGYMVLIWCLGGASAPFWPVWVILPLTVLVAVHALIVYWDKLPVVGRTRELSVRVDTLTRTRRGAVDVQAAHLRRIERDLHDGAQARLVALSMQLGRAEARLRDDPDTAALVRAARAEAGAAIAELRDLARGIAPPVLTDRGLIAAVRSLADRSTTQVDITEDTVIERLPTAVENAAYFIVSEALTNAAKHAPDAVANVTLSELGQVLMIDVADNGPGGADPHSPGLDGLRARVEALDGTFLVTSPPGGPTVVHAELPCGS